MIVDVVAQPDYQKQGIGNKIVKMILCTLMPEHQSVDVPV